MYRLTGFITGAILFYINVAVNTGSYMLFAWLVPAVIWTYLVLREWRKVMLVNVRVEISPTKPAEVQRLTKIEEAAQALIRTKKASEEYPQLEAALSEEPRT